jgi:hypothetical protein
MFPSIDVWIPCLPFAFCKEAFVLLTLLFLFHILFPVIDYAIP